MVSKLVIYQDHLNASSMSNNFYYKRGITGSYITSDITMDELLDIKKESKMDILFMVYGYAPIFYSKRYLISNYLKYIGSDKGENYKIRSDTGIEYIISEEENGTTIYTHDEINLINYLDRLNDIDYLVLDGNNIKEDTFVDMLDKFIKHDKLDNVYTGFIEKKTIYKVKNGLGDNNG